VLQPNRCCRWDREQEGGAGAAGEGVEAEVALEEGGGGGVHGTLLVLPGVDPVARGHPLPPGPGTR